MAVVRLCVCPRGHVGPPHSPECNQLHREAILAALNPQPVVALPASPN